MEILIGIGIFFSVVLLVEGVYRLYYIIRNPEIRRIRKELEAISYDGDHSPQSIEKKNLLSEIPWLNQNLRKIPKIEMIERIWRMSDSKYPLGFYFLFALLLVMISLIIIPYLFRMPFSFRLILSGFIGTFPFLILFRAKKKRMEKFERQLPDAVDLISRALKAGHAFTTGMRMVANELGDPIGKEFDQTLAEINFGINLNQSMKNLLVRVDCQDLKFFALSIILQKETGGNLAEILGNIGRLIRERFKLQRRIRVLSAEGRLSAVVLFILPISLAFILFLIRPDYIKVLVNENIGRIAIYIAAILQGIGFIVIKKIIRISV
jgi:tight adherence protein B